MKAYNEKEFPHTWQVLDINPSVADGTFVVYVTTADASKHCGGTLRNSCAKFDLQTVKNLLQGADDVFVALRK